MSLAERLAEATPKQGGLPCGISRIMSDMSEEDREALSQTLFSEPRTISNTQLHEILVDSGYDISYASIAQHRRKHCRCFLGRKPRVSGAANV